MAKTTVLTKDIIDEIKKTLDEMVGLEVKSFAITPAQGGPLSDEELGKVAGGVSVTPASPVTAAWRVFYHTS